MEWSRQQEQALSAVNKWYKGECRSKQVFYLAGFAGTGKTTLAKHFAESAGANVRFATFTGKAAHVMAQKGCVGASTIHKLIYRPKMMNKERLRELEKELANLLEQKEPKAEVLKTLKAEIAKEQENASRMNFSLNLESELRNSSLLIVDEVSMVNQQIGKDLESYGVPILVLGDPEQLPPVYGSGYFTEKEPDFTLTEIHRQALDNPIIGMAQLIREGQSLPLGNYGSSRVIDTRLEAEDILGHDIILTGLRKTKKSCDDRVRALKKFESTFPLKGDSVMCVKNNHQLGLLNGQIWQVASDAVTDLGDYISLHIKDEEGTEIAVTAHDKLFRGEAIDRWDHEQDVEEFEYAYAITVHKSQGSQWDDVLLFDQKERFPNWDERNRRRWLYTGVTRAAERVTVIRL